MIMEIVDNAGVHIVHKNDYTTLNTIKRSPLLQLHRKKTLRERQKLANNAPLDWISILISS